VGSSFLAATRPDLTVAPRWCAVDLRDGNQALIDPMNPSPQDADVRAAGPDGLQGDRGRLPVARARPTSTSCRQLIDGDHIPDDVTIQVLTQCREDLIERTYDAIAARSSAIVHFYNSTSILQRGWSSAWTKDGIIDIALQGARLCRKLEETVPETDVRYEYSPESPTPAPSWSSPSRSATRSSTSSTRPPTTRSSSTCPPPSR
jgi:2-isopropylmalate synthase